MRLNLPILDHLANSSRILIAGAGGGFDVFAGLPIYFTLREQGKTVHLANLTFTDFELAKIVSDFTVLADGLVIGVHSPVKHPLPYYPEGYLAQWLNETFGEDIPIWMFEKTGVVQMRKAYQALAAYLEIDALILVDGGVDSLMRGGESGPGTLVEDTMSLAAMELLSVPVKLLACVGFGTETEEHVCHADALENIAGLAKLDAFYGSCALTPQMPAFQQYEAACRYVWEQPSGHDKSHISTRIIPAVHGEFADYQMYPRSNTYVGAWISPLMSLYWFFNAQVVAERSLLLPHLRETTSSREAFNLAARFISSQPTRSRRSLPY